MPKNERPITHTDYQDSDRLLNVEALANIGSFEWEAATDKLEWSEHLYKIYGYEPFSIELSFDFFLSHLEEKKRQGFLDALYTNAETGSQYEFEEVITKNNGDSAILLSSIKPILDQEGELERVLGVCRDMTEIRAHDKMLSNQKAFYERILDQLPVQITVKDQESKFKLINKAYIQATSNNKVNPLTDSSKVSSDETDKLMRAKDKEAQSTDEDVKFETWVKNTEGRERFYSLIKKRLRDQNGESNDLLTIAWDRTDEYQLEEALRENEERLTVATVGGKLGIIDWNMQTGHVNANDTYFTIIGRTREEYTPNFESFKARLIYRPDLELVEKTFEEITTQKKSHYELEYRVTHPTKKIVWLSHKGSLIFKNNKPHRIVAVIQDITYRKNYADEITRSNTRMNNIIKSAPGAVFTLRPQEGFPVLSLSDQITQICGYLPKDFFPKGDIKFDQIIIENDRSINRTEMMKALADGRNEFQNTFRIITKNNSEKWIWMKAQFSKNENKEEILEGFLVDITEQVNAEDRVISAALQAEDNQRQRISEEIHDGVQQTLISSLMGLQNVKDVIQQKSPEIMDQFEMALQTLNSGVEETRGIAHSIMPKSIEDFGLIETIEQVIDQLNSNTITQYHFFENLQGERLGRKIEVSLYRIFQEAVNNINKHANANEVNIQIRKSKHVINMTIEDDGDGFDFSSFNQLKTGFGLASMKSRTGSLSGNVDISSAPGQGTTILVDVPISQS